MILALHSSPVPRGNLERMMLRVCKASGRPFEIIRLAEMHIKPCRGCLECAKTRRCIQMDGMSELYGRLEKAKGYVIGGVNFNDRLNAAGHLFLERLYPLYHRDPVFRGKPVVIAAVGGESPAAAEKDLKDYLEKIFFFDIMGCVSFRSGIYPCFSCGFGTRCPVSMPALHWSPEACDDFRKTGRGSFNRFEDDERTASLCDCLGRSLGRAVRNRHERV